MNNRLLPLVGKTSGKLLIHEIYRSIQGESTFAGLPCIFVRLSVCDSRCVWCDTPHAFTQGQEFSLDEIFQAVAEWSCSLVEITGGEPLLQEEVYPLMAGLLERGYQVLLETSGAHSIAKVDPRVHIIMDLKCPDSGEVKFNCLDNLALLKPTDEIKFVIASRTDFEWTREMIQEHRLDQKFSVLVSAVFERLPPRQLVDWVLESNLNVRMQLQMHKYIWDPKARGV